MQKEQQRENNFTALKAIDFPSEWGLTRLPSGKVRDIYELPGNRLILVATDRLSAFDKVLTAIPGRGQILNRLSEWWFDHTKDIVPNHMINVPDLNVMVVKKYPTYPIEMVVRGFLTGTTSTSIWTRYQDGERNFAGIILPPGMSKNEQLPYPIVDPTAKVSAGHDVKLTEEEILAGNSVSPLEWQSLKSTALALFARGQALADKAGLILVDTKYEFGRDPKTESIVLIDEIHTPDSSRYWGSDTYEARLSKGEDPDIYDKEFARLWYKSQEYQGEGPIPMMPQSIVNEVFSRYSVPFERLTGLSVKMDVDPEGRIIRNVDNWLSQQSYK
jgi:phosphoribosylaminoimidazole-succinocarboxamide synthase